MTYDVSNILPQDLLPYGSDKTVNLGQIFNDIDLLLKNKDVNLINLSAQRPDLADALRRLYLTRDILLDSKPDYFYDILNRLPREHNADNLPEGTIGRFLYSNLDVCHGHGHDRYCYPYKFDNRPMDYEHNTYIKAKDEYASIWVYVNNKFLGIPSTDTTKADIYIPYRSMAEFGGLLADDLKQLQEAGVEQVCFRSNTNQQDFKLTGYMPLDSVPIVQGHSSSLGNILDDGSDGTNGSSPGSAIWIYFLILVVIVGILLLIYSMFTQNDS